MQSNNSATIKAEADISRNYTDKEWTAVLSQAPMNKVIEELEYRLKTLQAGIDIFGGKSEWN